MHTALKDALREYHAHRCPGQQKHKAASGEIRPVKRTIAPPKRGLRVEALNRAYATEMFASFPLRKHIPGYRYTFCPH